jgi:hypothetical protein
MPFDPGALMKNVRRGGQHALIIFILIKTSIYSSYLIFILGESSISTSIEIDGKERTSFLGTKWS